MTLLITAVGPKLLVSGTKRNVAALSWTAKVPGRGGESGDTGAIQPSPSRFVLAENTSVEQERTLLHRKCGFSEVRSSHLTEGPRRTSLRREALTLRFRLRSLRFF